MLLEYESEQVQYAIHDPDPGEIETVYIPEDLQHVVFQKKYLLNQKLK